MTRWTVADNWPGVPRFRTRINQNRRQNRSNWQTLRFRCCGFFFIVKKHNIGSVEQAGLSWLVYWPERSAYVALSLDAGTVHHAYRRRLSSAIHLHWTLVCSNSAGNSGSRTAHGVKADSSERKTHCIFFSSGLAGFVESRTCKLQPPLTREFLAMGVFSELINSLPLPWCQKEFPSTPSDPKFNQKCYFRINSFEII